VRALSGGDAGERTRRGDKGRMLVEAEAMRGWAASSNYRVGLPRGAKRFSVVEVVGQRLVELEVGHGLRIGWVEARRLVEQEVPLGWAASRCEGRGLVGKVEVNEDGGDNRWVGEKGEDVHGAAAGGAEERQDLIDPGEEHGPADARRAGGARKFVQSAGGERDWLGGLGVGETRRLSRNSADGDDRGAQTGMGRQDTVVAVAVHAGRRHEGNEALQELEGREDDLGASVGGGFGKPIQKARVGRGKGGDAGESMESLEREGWPGAVTEEALEAGAVVTLDAHGSVDAEPTGSLPGKHVEGVELVEQPVGAEVPKHATLNDALEPGPVLGLEERRLVKASRTGVGVAGLREDAVEDDHVEVEVWVQGRAEAVQEADRAELGIGGRTGTHATERGADRA